MINIDFISPTNSGGNVVKSVNGKTGVVNLTAEDVHALPDTTEIPSIEGLATEEYVDAAVADVDVDLTGVATEEYVQKKIAEAQLSESDVDLSAYYTKSETDAAIEAAAPDLSGYALKTEIPSTSGLATEKYVDDAVAAIEIPEAADLSDYYTKAETDKKIADAATGGTVDLGNYYTKTETDDAIEQAVGAIKIPDVDLTGYATEQYVDDAIEAIEIPEATDLSNYYTKAEVDLLIPTTTGFITMSEVEAKGYQTEAQVNSLINTAISAIVNGDEVSY